MRSYPFLVWVITLEVSRRTLFTPEVVVTFSPGLSEPGAGMFFTLEIISLEMYSSQRSSEVDLDVSITLDLCHNRIYINFHPLVVIFEGVSALISTE